MRQMPNALRERGKIAIEGLVTDRWRLGAAAIGSERNESRSNQQLACAANQSGHHENLACVLACMLARAQSGQLKEECGATSTADMGQSGRRCAAGWASGNGPVHRERAEAGKAAVR